MNYKNLFWSSFVFQCKYKEKFFEKVYYRNVNINIKQNTCKER